jgi:hypothetical protein
LAPSGLGVEPSAQPVELGLVLAKKPPFQNVKNHGRRPPLGQIDH